MLRLLLMLSHVEAVSDLEELYRGTIAKEILSGLKTAFSNYQADAYSGGSLVTGAFGAVFFKCFGPSLFALKLVPLLFSLLTVLSTYLFLTRFWGSRTALFALALLACAPPHFVRLCLLAMGFHSEGLLGIVWILYWTFKIAEVQNPKRIDYFILGVLGGFSFWFTPITGVVWISSFLILCAAKRHRENRGAFFLILGLFLGLVPVMAYNLSHNGLGLKFLIRSFAFSAQTAPSVPKLFSLLFQGLPFSLGFGSVGQRWGGLVNHLYLWTAFVTILLAMNLKARSPRTAPIVLPGLFFFALYWISDFSLLVTGSYIDYRYFVFFHYLLILTVAIACGRVSWGKYPFLVLLLAGIWGQASLWFKEPWGRALEYRGYSYYQMGWAMQSLPAAERESVMRRARAALPERDFYFLAWSMAYGETSYKDNSLLWPQGMEWVLAEAAGNAEARKGNFLMPRANWDNLPELSELRTYYFEGLAARSFIPDKSRIPSFLNALEEIPENFQRPFYWNLGGYLTRRAWEESSPVSTTLDPFNLTPEALSLVYEGVGQDSASQWVYERRDLDAILSLAQVTEKKFSSFAWGLGWGIRRELNEDRSRAEDWIRKLPGRFQADALKGFHDCENRYRLPA